jgi:hypothetical protein
MVEDVLVRWNWKTPKVAAMGLWLRPCAYVVELALNIIPFAGIAFLWFHASRQR